MCAVSTGGIMKKIVIFIAIATVLMAVHILYSTASENTGCDCTNGNKRLKAQLQSGFIDLIGLIDANEWSTSILRPEGKGPKRNAHAQADPDYGCYHDERQYWSCKYSASSASDDNTKTGWCEGANGDGIGEIIIRGAEITQPMKIWNGLGLSDYFFKANNRVKRARVYVLAGRCPDAQQSCQDIKVLAKHDIELKDVNGFQSLPLPTFSNPGADRPNYLIALEILSVYSGLKFKDTCISEINKTYLR